MAKRVSVPPAVEHDRKPWARISVHGPHHFIVAWGVGWMRNGLGGARTVRGAERLRDRKFEAMRKRGLKMAAADRALGSR